MHQRMTANYTDNGQWTCIDLDSQLLLNMDGAIQLT